MGKSRENFIRLAESRTISVLRSLDLLGNLSNRSNYTFDEDDVIKIFGALSKKLKDVRSRFDESKKDKKPNEFRL